MARFLPIIRTFGCIVAGMAEMNYRTFLIYNVVGGVVWGFGMPLLGYSLGNLIGEDIDRYLLPIILLIITTSCSTSLFHLYKEHKAHKSKS
jgi:membrane-associated protein